MAQGEGRHQGKLPRHDVPKSRVSRSPLEKQASHWQNLRRIASTEHPRGLIKVTENNSLNLSNESLPNTLAFHTNTSSAPVRGPVAGNTLRSLRKHRVLPYGGGAAAGGMGGCEVQPGQDSGEGKGLQVTQFLQLSRPKLHRYQHAHCRHLRDRSRARLCPSGCCCAQPLPRRHHRRSTSDREGHRKHPTLIKQKTK